MPTAAVVILAAGSGARLGAGVNKVLLPVSGRPLVAWSVAAALALPSVDPVLVVVRAGEAPQVREALGELAADHRLRFTVGGETRHASERQALEALREDIDAGTVDVVAIHDAARPWARSGLFLAVIEAAREGGGGVPVLPRGDLVAREGDPLPSGLVTVQTPQAFRARDLVAAYEQADADGFEGTDTAASIERYAGPGLVIAAVPGDPDNRKVTFAQDLGR